MKVGSRLFALLQVFAVLKNFRLYPIISRNPFHGLRSETKALNSGESRGLLAPTANGPRCLPLQCRIGGHCYVRD
jgi:hypothetical protein